LEITKLRNSPTFAKKKFILPDVFDICITPLKNEPLTAKMLLALASTVTESYTKEPNFLSWQKAKFLNVKAAGKYSKQLGLNRST
jgi:hypothetical protein